MAVQPAGVSDTGNVHLAAIAAILLDGVVVGAHLQHGVRPLCLRNPFEDSARKARRAVHIALGRSSLKSTRCRKSDNGGEDRRRH